MPSPTTAAAVIITPAAWARYDNPLTVANDTGERKAFEMICLPYFKMYLRIEDGCAQYQKDWEAGQEAH